ncbi:MAG: hypothetical protein AB1722_02385 [Pseudomonadota bacterium]
MRKLVILACTTIGLGIGYALFGKVAGHYVSPASLFQFGGNALQSAWHSVSGLEAMRNKILLCGVAGMVVGVLWAARRGK